jgi:hypothetical protein
VLERAVVHEGPATVAERVGILEGHSADRRPSHVRQNGLGIGPAGGTARNPESSTAAFACRTVCSRPSL